MSKRSLKLLCCVPLFVLLLGTPLWVGATPAALSAAWTWIGAGADTNWTNCDNWASVSIPIGEGCWPDDAGDGGTFPLKAGGGVWGNVDLDFNGTITIDGMVILDGVDFVGHQSNPPTLEVTGFTIDAADAATTVTFRDHMVFIAHGS